MKSPAIRCRNHRHDVQPDTSDRLAALREWVLSRRTDEPPRNAYDAGYDEAMADVQEWLRAAGVTPAQPAPDLRAAAQAVCDTYAHFEDCYPVGPCTCGMEALRAALEATA